MNVVKSVDSVANIERSEHIQSCKSISICMVDHDGTKRLSSHNSVHFFTQNIFHWCTLHVSMG